MEQLWNFGDQRQVAWCAYCGRGTSTRDHVPSKVLLDKPYPENLPVVPACRDCNEGLSIDEEYVACLMECATTGSAFPSDVWRPKVQRILSEKPALAARLAASREQIAETTQFSIEGDRVKRVLLKLGRGHALFELNEPQFTEPSNLVYVPLPSLPRDIRTRFEELPEPSVWPEVGSRAMQRLVEAGDLSREWIVVQPSRYRYVAFAESTIVVRIVLSEYLGCEVVWGEN